MSGTGVIMKFIAALTLAAFVFFNNPAGASSKPFNPVSKIIFNTELSTVKITRPLYGDEDGLPHSYVCTGFVVDAARGWVLTAAHCIDQDDLSETLVDGDYTWLIADNGTFALLHIDEMKKPPLDIRKDNPEIGEAVVSFGYGYGDMQVFYRHVASYSTDDDTDDIVTDGPLAPGMSGGPIVDLDGKVVGVNQGANSVLGIACGPHEINKFLKSVK